MCLRLAINQHRQKMQVFLKSLAFQSCSQHRNKHQWHIRKSAIFIILRSLFYLCKGMRLRRLSKKIILFFAFLMCPCPSNSSCGTCKIFQVCTSHCPSARNCFGSLVHIANVGYSLLKIKALFQKILHGHENSTPPLRRIGHE